MIREAIAALVNEGRHLSEEEAAAVMEEIMAGEATPAQVAAFLVALRTRGETVEEVVGMARVMRQKALRLDVSGPLLDTCGTGGDGRGTFNASTAAAIVAAAAGARVAKHGNRAASSHCGSADLLEALGARIDLGPQQVAQCLQETGLGFLFAPLFHPAMRHAAGVRREIGVRTVFNLLGPLTNPAGVQYQLLGVPHPALGDLVAQALQRLGVRRALVVHGAEGLDEVSVCGPTLVWEASEEGLRHYQITPEEAGLSRSALGSVLGRDPVGNAALLRAVLGGERGPLRDFVLLNAGVALVAAGLARDPREGTALASETIDSGAALRKLEEFVATTQRLAAAAAQA
jgi:anthranilate phosphoribosyltransferase